MHRIDSPTATTDNRFTEGNPMVPIAATVVSADWLNAVQEEIATVVETAKIPLKKDENTQLVTAIRSLITAHAPKIGQATTEDAGIGELATLAEAKAGTPGCLLITAETLLEVLNELDAIINIAKQVNTLGDFRLFGFRAADLPAGWHVCNGGGFATTSAQGKALAALPANFKADWKITVSGGTIYKPNLLTGGAVSGQGPFFRPSTSVPGTVVADAIRNITGEFAPLTSAGFLVEMPGSPVTGYASGAFKKATQRSRYISAYDSSTFIGHDVGFSASGSVPTAAENRPLSVAMTPALWLGC